MSINIYFTHFKFSRKFLGHLPAPCFEVPQCIQCGRGRIRRPAKSPILNLERSILHFFHSKSNFKKLGNDFEKLRIGFWGTIW